MSTNKHESIKLLINGVWYLPDCKAASSSEGTSQTPGLSLLLVNGHYMLLKYIAIWIMLSFF